MAHKGEHPTESTTLSTSTKPIIESSERGNDSPARPRVSKNVKRGLLVGLFVIPAVAVVAFVVMIVAAVFVASGDDSTKGNAGVVTDEVMVEEPATPVVEEPAPVVDTTATTIEDPADLLVTFAAAWTAGDFEAMQAYASQDAIGVAELWHDGGEALISTDNVQNVLDGCSADGSCEFLYAPTEGFGLIFNVTYADSANGLTITGLEFAGDAG